MVQSGGNMKKMYFLACVIFISFNLSAQLNGQPAETPSEEKSNGSLPIGFGATFIDGETYYLMNIAQKGN
jgi:hypothetical protein